MEKCKYLSDEKEQKGKNLDIVLFKGSDKKIYESFDEVYSIYVINQFGESKLTLEEQADITETILENYDGFDYTIANDDQNTLKDKVFAIGDPKLIDDWRHLQTSDHPYYMCTKYFNDGGVHAYFSPYDSPFDAFQYFMNVIRDMRLRVDPEAKDGESATLPKPEAVTIDKIDE